MTEARPVTVWTIAGGILLALAILAVLLFAYGVWSDRQDGASRDRVACEDENDRWRERGVPERVRDC